MTPTEYSKPGFCDLLPEDIRGTVEMMVPQFLPETWPVRFAALLSMLEDLAAQVEEVDRPVIVNNWVITISGLLEHLPLDLSSPECLALMRHSLFEQFQECAVRQSSDVDQQNELLRNKYPQWSMVEDLLRDHETWVAKQLLTKPH